MSKPVTPPKAPPRPLPPPERLSKDKRKPFGSMDQKLYYPQREGYHRHWFNEKPGRLDAALDAGYTFVLDREQKKVSRVVDVAPGGGPLHAWLMEIPQEWFEEDMKRQQKVVDEREDTIKKGLLETTPGDGRYIPSQGITIKTGKV